jgi:hypothetical protein
MPKPRNRRADFKAQITKPKLSVLRPKPGNPSPPWFWDSTKKLTTDFEAKPGETIATSFEIKLEKTVATGFEVKQRKPSEWFWGQTTHKSSTLVLRLNPETRAPRLHVHGADRTRRHPTTRLPGHRVPDMCDHSRSSASGLVLLSRSSSLHVMPHLPPAHHKTSKHNSPNETMIKKTKWTISNLNSNLVKSMTQHNQIKELTTWFLNLPLDESIDNKGTKFEVRILNLMKHR